MRKFLLLAFSCVAGSMTCSQGVVVQNVVTIGPGSFGADQQLGTSAASFGVDAITSTRFDPTWVTAGLAFAYFHVQDGDALTWYTLDLADAFVRNGAATPNNEFDLPNGASMLLGFWVDRDESHFNSPNDLTLGDDYGWVRIQNQNGTLVAISSAMAQGGPGIYAGTLNTIPEPATTAVALSGAWLLGLRRRRC